MLRDVDAPQLVPSIGDELAPHEVVMDRLSRSLPPLVPVTDPPPADHSQQPRDALATDPVSAYYLTCRSPYDLTCRSVSAS
jgi:hypothetical protein